MYLHWWIYTTAAVRSASQMTSTVSNVLRSYVQSTIIYICTMSLSTLLNGKPALQLWPSWPWPAAKTKDIDDWYFFVQFRNDSVPSHQQCGIHTHKLRIWVPFRFKANVSKFCWVEYLQHSTVLVTAHVCNWTAITNWIVLFLWHESIFETFLCHK